MTEKNTKKKDKRPPEVILAAQLKAAHGQRSAIKPAFEAQRKAMASQRKETLQSDLGKRMKAIKELKQAAEAKKAEAKKKKDAAFEEARLEYEQTEEQAAICRAEAEDSAKCECEETYRAISEQLQKDSVPIVEQHLNDEAETEESFKTEIAAIDKKEQEAIELAKATISKLEESIEKLKKKKEGKAA
jgi:hypothetical protein